MSDTNWQLKEGDPSAPNCGACPGDGSICATSCKVAEESPPVVSDITTRLREFDDGNTQTCILMGEAIDYIIALESEADQLRMTVHNARIELAEVGKDAARYLWLRERHWSESNLFVIAGHHSLVQLGTHCPSGDELDSVIDAAMTKDAA